MFPRTTTLTSKGQLTIPAAIRHELGLQTGDKLLVERCDDTVVLRRAGSVVEMTAGAGARWRKVPAPTPEEEDEAFAQAIAEENAGYE